MSLPERHNRLGLDSQTVFGMHPVDHIRLAAELGCAHVSLGPSPVPWKLERFPAWSLLDDAELRRTTRSALRDTGINLALAEGFTIRPGIEARDRIPEFDLMADLGAKSAGAVSMEPDAARALEQMAILAQLAAERDMLFMFEFAPPHTFNSLPAAFRAVREIGQPNVRLLIDAMHLHRTAATPLDLAKYPSEIFGYIQICDAPLAEPDGDYYLEACFDRKCPGDGDLPLLEILEALPHELPVGLEVPMQLALTKADDIRVAIKRIVDAGKRLLSETSPA